MSLINQMLQDLEQRSDASQGSSANRQYTQFGTPAPAVRKMPVAWLGLGLMVAIFLATFLLMTRPNKTAALTENEVQSEISAVSEAPLSLSLKMATAIDQSSITEKNTKAEYPNQLPSATLNEKPDTTPRLPPPETVNVGVGSISKSAGEEIKSTPKPEKVAPTANIAMVKEMSPQQRAEGEFRQASVLQQQGRSSEAILALEQALRLDARHTPARQSLVSLLLEQSRQDDAMRELKAALAIDPAQVNFAMMLARLQLERAKLNEAIATLHQSLPQAQDRPDYLAFLAGLYQKLGQHKEAAQWYRVALKMHPQNGVWWMGLGISLQADGQNQEAVDAFKQAKVQSGLSAELLAFVDQKISQLQK